MRTPIILVVVALLGLVGLSCTYIVDERNQALVLAFGKVDRVTNEPGLHFKLPPPFESVEFFEDRILPLETDELEVTPLDDRRLAVDAFARWKIVDPVKFRQSVQTFRRGQDRLQTILNAQLREVLGSVTSNEVLSSDRAKLMLRIRDRADAEALKLGVDIVDVRIRRADLPEQNLNATYARMNAERDQEAKDERARGQEQAQIIRAQADKVFVELTSDAQKKSDIIRGEADAKRNAIFADAYGKDPEFFAFYRTLRAYETALQGNNCLP